MVECRTRDPEVPSSNPSLGKMKIFQRSNQNNTTTNPSAPELKTWNHQGKMEILLRNKPTHYMNIYDGTNKTKPKEWSLIFNLVLLVTQSLFSAFDVSSVVPLLVHPFLVSSRFVLLCHVVAVHYFLILVMWPLSSLLQLLLVMGSINLVRVSDVFSESGLVRWSSVPVTLIAVPVWNSDRYHWSHLLTYHSLAWVLTRKCTPW